MSASRAEKLCYCGHTHAEHDERGRCGIVGVNGSDWRCPCPGFTEAHGLTDLQLRVLRAVAERAPAAGTFIEAAALTSSLTSRDGVLMHAPSPSAVGRALGMLARRGLVQREDRGYYSGWRAGDPAGWEMPATP